MAGVRPLARFTGVLPAGARAPGALANLFARRTDSYWRAVTGCAVWRERGSLNGWLELSRAAATPVGAGDSSARARARRQADALCRNWLRAQRVARPTPTPPTLPTWPDPKGLAPPPGLPITRKVRVGVEVAAIIAGMLVLMGIIDDIGTGLHDLNETSQK